MYSFTNDYSEGCHPAILSAFTKINYDQNSGYCTDRYCKSAEETLRKLLRKPSANVHFLIGGTMANCIAIDSMLRPWEAIISSDIGHINVMETGAVEGNGHKILPVLSPDGKLTPERIDFIVQAPTSEHVVKPRAVYITNATEVGTVYTKAELQALSQYCRAHDLYLFLDGARLCSALAAPNTDLTLSDIADLVDIMCLGMCKNGALFGEALIILREELNKDMRRLIKHHCGLYSKGWLIGLQFEILLNNNIFLELATHANYTAKILRDGIRACGYTFLSDSPINIQFPIFPQRIVDRLLKRYTFIIEKTLPSGDVVTRLSTSWVTKEAECHGFIKTLKAISSI